MRAAALLLSVLLMASVARADDSSAADRETARIAFAEGNKLRDDGNVRGALEKYKAAFALAPTPVTALEVGRAESDLGQLVEAREALLHVDAMSSKNESPKAQAARAEASAMAQRIAARTPKVTLHVVGLVDGATITIDGSPIPHAALAVARVVNPGKHVVLGVVEGHTAQQTFELREGEARELTLELPRSSVKTQPLQPSVLAPQPGTNAGVVAFNTPEDGHGWTLRDGRNASVCNLPCTQSLGFATGYKLVRDDGESVVVPPGLAVLPGTGAQVTPSGSAGNPTAGWILVATGGALFIGSIVVLPPTLGSNDISTQGAGLAVFGALALAGSITATVGLFFLMLAHGPMLLRTDMGMPMRIARGIVGTF